MERWKDIPGYENLYQVSDMGNLRSLDRVVNEVTGRTYKGSLMNPSPTGRYKGTTLSKNTKRKVYHVHVLVAMAFHGHVPGGHSLVVDHINNNSTDNRAVNLRVIPQRENASRGMKRGRSKHVGVDYLKDGQRIKRWRATIHVNKKRKSLGYFEKEEDAAAAYQAALKELK